MPSFCGWRNPSASNASSQGICFSDPGISLKVWGLPGSGLLHSIPITFNAFNAPFSSPINSLVTMLQLRSQPSSCELEVLKIMGQLGQGILSVRPAGGLLSISICVTDLAPWRLDVPTQSEPVSPPPSTTVFFPLAE